MGRISAPEEGADIGGTMLELGVAFASECGIKSTAKSKRQRGTRGGIQLRNRRVLQLTGVAVVRGGTNILRQITWAVAPGQHWAILGANGSGKTSLLSVITGYLMPTAGEFELMGRRYGETDWRELRKRVGLVSSSVRQLMADDELALDTVISGKYAMIDLWKRGTRQDQADAKKLLRRVECAYLAARPWRVLSQGERQRVLIGRALMAKPVMLILDEACAGLDPAAREQFLQFLQRLSRQPQAPTLIFVTHHVEEIIPAITHALVLRQGRMLAAGPKRKVLTAAVLTTAFRAQVKLALQSGRYQMRLCPRGSSVA